MIVKIRKVNMCCSPVNLSGPSNPCLVIVRTVQGPGSVNLTDSTIPFDKCQFAPWASLFAGLKLTGVFSPGRRSALLVLTGSHWCFCRFPCSSLAALWLFSTGAISPCFGMILLSVSCSLSHGWFRPLVMLGWSLESPLLFYKSFQNL